MKTKNMLAIATLVLLLIGAVFTAVGGGLYLYFENFKRGAAETEAVIVQTRGMTGSAVISYWVNGTQYETGIGEYSSTWRTGQTITVYVDPDDPYNVHTNLLTILGIIFGAIGLAFLLAALILLFANRAKRSGSRNLIASGRRITADITDVIQGGVRVNGRFSSHIICDWRGPDGKTYRFKSEALWINPSAELERRGIKTLPVYIDGERYKKHYVDIGVLTDNIVDLT